MMKNEDMGLNDENYRVPLYMGYLLGALHRDRGDTGGYHILNFFEERGVKKKTVDQFIECLEKMSEAFYYKEKLLNSLQIMYFNTIRYFFEL